MAGWKWTKKRHKAAEMLSEGYTFNETAAALGVGERSLYRWNTDSVFKTEVELLTLITGIASRVNRLRTANRVYREKTAGDRVETKKDLLDWMEYARTETGANAGQHGRYDDDLDEIAEYIYGEKGDEGKLPENDA